MTPAAFDARRELVRPAAWAGAHIHSPPIESALSARLSRSGGRGAVPEHRFDLETRNVDAASPRTSAQSADAIFHSILFEKPNADVRVERPSFFVDLNLDQIVDAITAGRDEYDLKPFFYTQLRDVSAIRYRREIMQDLENPALHDHVKSFAIKMRSMRQSALKDCLRNPEIVRYLYDLAVTAIENEKKVWSF
jgi:hypothetical protein